jgi:hypothetical protein
MVEAPTRYSDADLAEFKEIILNKTKHSWFRFDKERLHEWFE